MASKLSTPRLLAFGEQQTQLVDLEEGRLGRLGQQTYCIVLLGQPPLLRCGEHDQREALSGSAATSLMRANAATAARG